MKALKQIYLAAALALFCPGYTMMGQAVTFTYNHDASKMNQFTVQETGVGNLTPAVYYNVAHKKYSETAHETNKSTYRAQVAVSTELQTVMADSLKNYLEDRAEVEAMNILDREVDIAYSNWQPKLSSRIAEARELTVWLTGIIGPGQEEITNWGELWNQYEYSIGVVHNAYLANSEKEKMYISIYNELTSWGNQLAARYKQAKFQQAANDLLSGDVVEVKRNTKDAAIAAFNKWRNVGNTGMSGTYSENNNQ